MAKYRKLPVVIEAVQWTVGNIDDIFRFMSPQEPLYLAGFSDADDIIGIHTLEGTMVARTGDWIIRGVSGEFYPCKPDIFASTYEPA